MKDSVPDKKYEAICEASIAVLRPRSLSFEDQGNIIFAINRFSNMIVINERISLKHSFNDL